MNTIHLSNLCPNIFSDADKSTSDIWKHDVVFEKGKIYLVEATSGAGKSSLCNYIYGSRNDYQGELFFDRKNTRDLQESYWTLLRRRHLSHLMQDMQLFPELTAYENIEIKNVLTHHFSKDNILQKLHDLGIFDKKDIPIKQLSLGQQQKIAFIRALSQPFDFILLDEPISHLDETNVQPIVELLLKEIKHTQAGVIVTSIGKHLPLPYNHTFHL